MAYFRTLTDVILKNEIVQRREEGYDVSGVENQLNGDQPLTTDEVEGLHRQIEALPAPVNFPYHEPSDLEGIRAARPDGPRKYARPNEVTLSDKMLGAWLGRAAGCLLGKPVEGLHHDKVEQYLKAVGEYPLNDYMPLIVPLPDGLTLHHSAPVSTRGNFDAMPRDDDIDYTILGLHLLEQHGENFTTQDVANAWLALLPYHMVYTAERIAYRNLVNEMPLEQAAIFRNPYREWIGAQIRADGWGYGAAAWPEKAAEFAWRDACVSHVKNGIYGEMWAAAAIAAAFHFDLHSPEDIRKVIEIGLSEIPANCRLSEAINDVLSWPKTDWQTAWSKINEKYGHYHWVHTINNALIVVLGLLYGDGDYSQSICIAVMGGWDTDCNGATVGSILGAMMGAKALPERWTQPLNDRMRSAVIGFDSSTFSNLAERSVMVNRVIWGQD